MPVRAALLLLALAPLPALGQGFAGLGQGSEGFEPVVPGRQWSFPADHGPHPGFRIEWWYLTANLTDAAGADYGLQWTLFRTELAPGGPQVWFAHAAATTETGHWSAERAARDGIGQAGVTAAPFEAFIDEWRMAGDRLDALRLTAGSDAFAYDMQLAAQGPLIFHGDNGFSLKSGDGQASYYYSQPFYTIAGTLILPDGPHELSGSAWLDREFSSQPLGEGQEGWDWFSLSLDDGAKLMAFNLRGSPAYSSATYITAEGEARAYGDGALAAAPLETDEVAGRELPLSWQLSLPAEGLDLVLEAINPQAWMAVTPPYWEGPVRVRGSDEGRGYLEMTGYE